MAVANHNDKYSKRQARILTYSAKVIAREGYGNASIRCIAREMGMSISAIYYYFKSKEELLFSIQYTSFAELVEKLEARLEGVSRPDEKLFIVIENHLEYFLRRLNELNICSHEINTLKGAAYRKVRDVRRRYYDIALEIVVELKGGRKGTVLEPTMATLNLFGMLNWIYMWYDPKKKISSRVMAEEIYNLFLNGFNSKSLIKPFG